MGYNYEVGDIVTLKNHILIGSKEWEILRVGAVSIEMHGMRTSDYDKDTETGRKNKKI